MSSTYPQSKQTFENPSASDPLDSPNSHSQMHRDIHDTLTALEDKVGMDGDTNTASYDYHRHNESHDQHKQYLRLAGRTAGQTVKDDVMFTGDTVSFHPKAKISKMPYAMIVDGYTENQVINPSFEVNVTDGWSAVGGGASKARLTTDCWVGSACMEVTIGTAAADQGAETATFSCSASTEYWARVAIKSISGTTSLTLGLVGSVSGASERTITISSDWAIYYISKTTGASDATLKLQILNNAAAAAVFRVDGVQVEKQTTAPTTYADGSMGFGYAWAGTAHNSKSIREAGLHLLDKPDQSGYPFVINRDGTIGEIASKENLTVRDTHTFSSIGYLKYLLGHVVTNAALGDTSGVYKIENTGNGVALWAKSAVTTDFGVILDFSSLTSGTGLGIAAPSDKSTMISAGGAYFKFFDKSGKDDFKWTPNYIKVGVTNETIRKYIWGLGGGSKDSAGSAQYEPFMIVFEGPNGDHKVAQTADYYHNMWFGKGGRPKYLRGTSPNSVSFPSSDASGNYFVHELDRDSAQTIVASSNAETTIYSFAVPPNTLGTSSGLRATVYGQILKNTIGTLTIKVKLGSSTLVTTMAETLTNNATRYAFVMRVYLHQTAQAAQKCFVEFLTKVQVDDGNFETILKYGSGTVDSSSKEDLKITTTWSASSASLSFEKEFVVLEGL